MEECTQYKDKCTQFGEKYETMLLQVADFMEF